MENIKTEIINFALQLIQEKGYVAFSYNDISKHFNVTKASVHYHFRSKEDLGLAVCDKLIQEIKGMYFSAQSTQLPDKMKILQYIKKRIDDIQNPGICPISSMQADYESLPPSMQSKVQQLSELELEYLANILKQAIGGGKSCEDTYALAATILASLKGAVLYSRVTGKDLVSKVLGQLEKFLV
ncbi:hypothetical protein SPSIL_036380 [Sporomusa silvacetica DSM 10669]|uniref:HTH tetR-type domain-containing protein n=1 Tax=Sporomusa silvacetica DSM 10669 TaxID=1123289 RepID=A0ABZ3IPU6_9FIRM|nr:TetR/AcrR family transcriptional regulator [Sporomusa silvacetica]OZC19821.1 DNA-binding transcriptional repressor AcrR [Sporomusa silvacetica DSM 10669]